MNFEEFLQPRATDEVHTVTEENVETPVEPVAEPVEESDPTMDLHVQQAVVESLAADKAEQDEHIAKLRKDNYALQSEISALKEKIAEMKVALEQVGDVLAKNAETTLSNKMTLLERNPEVEDRFPGEMRDHVLETLKEAREAAEKDGRVRRAQILEAILVDNEVSGELAKRRAALEKLFNDNQNILSGPVINELDNMNIPYKHGEDYLLPAEIIKRTY